MSGIEYLHVFISNSFFFYLLSPSLIDFCVSSGCYSKIHRLSGLWTTDLFFKVLEAGKSRIMALADLVSRKDLLLGYNLPASPVSTHDEGARESLWSLFHKV